MKDHHDFPHEVVDLNWRFKLSSDEDFDRPIIFKDFIELIEHSLIIFLLKLFSTFLFVFNCYWLLSLLSWQFLPLLSFLHLNLIFEGSSFVMNLDSFLFVLYLVRHLLKCSAKLFHRLGSDPNSPFLGLSPFFFAGSRLFCHCW